MIAVALLALVWAADYTGPQACAECHARQYQQQKDSHHANALRPILQSPLKLSPMKERDGAAFAYSPGHYGVELTATRGSGVFRAILEWSFGAGSQAFTPVGRLDDGRFFEHRISWFSAGGGKLGLTPGHSTAPSLDAETAIGIVQAPDSIYRCFNCHAANVKPGPDLRGILPGVTCERCHGAGSDHIAAARSGKPAKGTIFNAGKLSAKAIVPVCAECHRSPNVEYRSEMPEVEDPLSVRFAPVGLSASRCFQKSAKLSCISCHDPHENPKPAADASYTRVCQGCHPPQNAAAAACKAKQTANCVSCHMKSAAPVPNLKFTDHRIRVYYF